MFVSTPISTLNRRTMTVSDLIVSLGTGLSGGYTGSQWVIRMTWRDYVGEGRDRYLWRALVQAQKALQAAKGGA